MSLKADLKELSEKIPGPEMFYDEARVPGMIMAAQRILGVKDDGIAGPITLAALDAYLRPHQGEETHARYEHPAKTRAQAASRYGSITPPHWPNQGKWMIYVPVPAKIQAYLKITRIYCNKDMALALQAAFQNVIEHGCEKEFKKYDGCLSIRSVRGGTNLSCHAYGLALDFNADQNPLGATKSAWSSSFVKCFTDAGFSWGGNFKGRKDPMHFSFAWE